MSYSLVRLRVSKEKRASAKQVCLQTPLFKPSCTIPNKKVTPMQKVSELITVRKVHAIYMWESFN